jgi:hypothetical protein
MECPLCKSEASSIGKLEGQEAYECDTCNATLILNNKGVLVEYDFSKQKQGGSMAEEKKDEDRCNAIIKFGDDYGDNETTFHCQLKKGHKGSHQESGDQEWMLLPEDEKKDVAFKNAKYTVTWENKENG